MPVAYQNQLLIAELESQGLSTQESERGLTVYVPYLYFDYASAELTSLAVDKLVFVAAVSQKYLDKTRRVAVEGYTDSVGSESFNLHLSKQRAITVSNILEHHGASPYKIQIAWFGESKPLLPNTLSNGSDNPEGRAVNRRVEIIFLN